MDMENLVFFGENIRAFLIFVSSEQTNLIPSKFYQKKSNSSTLENVMF